MGAAVLTVALALVAHGCAQSGGAGTTSHGGSVTHGGSSAGAGGSAANVAQRNVALAALAAPSEPRLTAASLAAFDDLLVRDWPHAMTFFGLVAESSLRAAAGKALGGVSVVSVTAVQLDASAAPRLTASLPTASPAQTIFIEIPPAPSSWALRASIDVGGTIPFTVLGVHTSITVLMRVDVAVTDVRIRESGVLDLSSPTAPTIASYAAPVVDMRLSLSSPDPLFSTIASTLTQVLDPIVRVALLLAPPILHDQLGLALGQMPNTGGWGRGGPALPAPAGTPDLLSVADRISTKIRSDMSPFGQVYPTEYSQPVQGGVVVGYRHFGDSALWTGGLLAAESLRADLTGDPRALAEAEHILAGVELLSEVVPAPYEGLLARCAVPAASPFAAPFGAGQTEFPGFARGASYVCEGDTSRDSYTGITLGLGQAVHRLPPPLKARAGLVAGRLVDHLERYGWAVYQAPGQRNNPAPGQPRMSVTCVQSPGLILALVSAAATGDPARYAALRARYADLADMLWLPSWESSQEVHEAYFKFSLGNMALVTLESLETDPARYRGYLQDHAIHRVTVAHHQNPWFDAAWAAAVPAALPAVAPDVRVELEQWTSRPRRGFDANLMNDPTVAKVLYTPTLPNATGAPSGGVQTGPRPQWVAAMPVPIPKRPTTAFLWSSSPFDLEGWEDARVEHPGVDFLLPYWLARSYAVIP